MQVCSARRWRVQWVPSAEGPGPERRLTAPGKGQALQAGAVWESARLASPTLPACPAADTDEHVRTGAPGSVCIYPHSHFVNQETGLRQGKSAKAGSLRRARASRLPCPGGPAGVASSDVSATNPAPGNANGVNTCWGHIQEPSVCLVPAGAHPALCSLTTPPQHTHTCAHLCTPRLQSRLLASSPRCSSRVTSQPHVHDPVRQNREGTALKHLSPHTRKTTCQTRWILPSHTPTDTDKETLNTEPNCGG